MPTTNQSGSSSSQPLPPKENALFKRILKCYEQKQYKNGLKFAKQILSHPKFSEHGETLAMKGLTLNCLGRKEEAYDYVRRGLRNDLKSHVCWHVFGLLQRSDKKYDEAIKCYRNALKWDKDNIQILRDLSLLQIQMRDLDGYKETRYQLFQLRPTQRASWIGFAMSHHLLNDHDMTLKILEEFRKTQQKAAYDYEHSELLLYQNMVIHESGESLAALEHLIQYQDQICDKATLLETKGTLLIENNRLKEAEELFVELIRRNPENHSYYRKLEEATQSDTVDKKLALYQSYREKYPKSQAPQRLPLEFATGDDFKKLLDTYFRKALRKGIPPLFVDIRPLYADPEKAKAIEDLCLNYLKNLKSHQSFDAKEKKTKETPTVLLWLFYFLGQHHDYLKQYEEALQYVETAIEHTPTLIELYLLKGKIYKHVGNMEEAVRWLDEAQSLDTADRYINCKCAKYMLGANKVREAEEMCQKFTREGVSPTENLNEMQCMWFQTECAAAFKRTEQWGEALKKCIEVDRHFTEIIEDQFDFHTYCMRKMTLKSYVDLLRLEDIIRSHKFYEKAAHCAINVYLRLHDKPVTDDDKLKDLITDDMDPAELKKLRNKQKKAEKKAELAIKQQQQQMEKKEKHNKSLKKTSTNNADEELDTPSKDELIPEKLERPEAPLEEALKFLSPLQLLASKHLMTHVLAFEIYYRKQRPLLMLQSLKKLLKVSTDDHRVHGCLVRFHKFVEDKRKDFPEPVKQVLDREAKDIFVDGKVTASSRNAEYIQRHRQSLPRTAVGVKMSSTVLESSKAEKTVELLLNLDSFLTGVDLENCVEIYDSLNLGEFGPAGKAISPKFGEQCSRRFPHAQRFKAPCSTTTSTTKLANNGPTHEP